MLYEQKMTGSVINWPVKPKDAVGVPQEPLIVKLLEANKCTCKVGVNCYEIINEKGDALELPFGCKITDWVDAVRQVASV